ncbi:hypothetical protein MBLNU230_g8568t1 [Neophaeotheca triangularis]
MSRDQLEEDLAFTEVMLQSLDSGADDYAVRLGELLAEKEDLQNKLENLSSASSQQQNQARGSYQNGDGYSNGNAHPQSSDFWQTAMNGHYGGAGASGNGAPASSRTVSAASSFGNQSNKRPRPQSSTLGIEERPSKIRTPDHSSPDDDTSSMDDFELIENPDAAITEKHRKRQLEIEATIAQKRAAVQADAEFARRFSQQNGYQQGSTSSNSSSSNGHVQTTIGHGGSFAKPPPSQVKTEYSGQVAPSPMRNSMTSRPWEANYNARTPQVKPEPGPSRQPQRLPQRLHDTGTVDLTASDSEDEPQFVARPTPTVQRSNPYPYANSTQHTPHRPSMPGSYPSAYGNNSPYVYGNDGPRLPPVMQNGGYNQALAESLRAARNAASGAYGQGMSHLQQLGGLIGGSSAAGLSAYGGEISDDDDDDAPRWTGTRNVSHYAGMEELYNSRYREIASYDPAKTKEEINSLLENIRPDEDLPADALVKTPEPMSIKLHKYQEMGLTWLTKAEEGKNQGGILGDEMGLGKTIQMLSLMVSRKSDDPRCKTTLIVAPVALLRQWKQEIQHKIRPGRHALSVYTHHGASKKHDFNDFRHYDVVLTTYGSLASEVKRQEKFHLRKATDPQAQPRKDEKCVLIGHDKLWYRVLLDEAQCIKNKGTQTSKGACMLNAKYRFCMTGTPMMNNVEELFSLIKFLKVKPYCVWESFRKDFTQPLKSGNDDTKDRAMQKLQALCKAIMLRRTKSSTYEGKPILVLPQRTTDTDNVEFSQDETDFYKALESRSQLQFNKYLKKGTVGTNYSAVLVLLLRLRQACCHPHLIRDFGVSASADITPDAMVELAKQLEPHVVTRIKETEGNFECPVCYDAQTNPAIFFPCGHDTCQECFAKIADPAAALQQGNEGSVAARCPECRGAIDPKKVTDFASFKKVHMPELLTEAERAGMQEEDEDSDSDSEDDDNEDEPESWDDVDEQGNLDGFVVGDEEVEMDVKDKKKKKKAVDFSENDDFPPVRRRKVVDEASETQSEDGQPGPSGSGVKKEPGIKNEQHYDDEEADIPDIFKQFATARTDKGKGKAKVKDEAGEDEEDVKREDSNSKPKKAKKSKKARGKEKKEKKEKRASNAITLAQLKKDSTRNNAARKRYIKRLRKDYVSSAKIDKTMEILTNIMNTPQSADHAEPERILIFSQWTSLLDLVEVPIDNAGWGYRRYDGSLSARMRGDAVDDFNDPRANVRIMLVSLKAGNAGLNLNKASQVIILDPFWNPYIEEQAIDRAHRIGQEREVKVHRVLVPETVEDRIIALQEKKRELISTALDEKAAASISRLGVRELAYLFGVTGSAEQNVQYQAQPPRPRGR